MNGESWRSEHTPLATETGSTLARSWQRLSTRYRRYFVAARTSGYATSRQSSAMKPLVGCLANLKVHLIGAASRTSHFGGRGGAPFLHFQLSTLGNRNREQVLGKQVCHPGACACLHRLSHNTFPFWEMERRKPTRGYGSDKFCRQARTRSLHGARVRCGLSCSDAPCRRARHDGQQVERPCPSCRLPV